MDTIYRCPECGFETSFKEIAEKHNCKNIFKYKKISLELYNGKIKFSSETSDKDTRFWTKPTTEHITLWNDDNLLHVETTDVSKEKEKELKVKLLEAAINSRRERVSKAEDEISRFEERIKDIKEDK